MSGVMRAGHIAEPELEFYGGQRHVDIRFGIMDYGPLDLGDSPAASVRLGIVGTSHSAQGLVKWLEQAAGGLAAKLPSRQPNLFPRFPGYGPDSPFKAELVTEERSTRAIRQTDFDAILGIQRPRELAEAAADLLLGEIRYLAEDCHVDVIACPLPHDLLDALKRVPGGDPEGGDGEEGSDHRLNFRGLLKARAMQFNVPLQLLLPETYGGSRRRKKRGSSWKVPRGRRVVPTPQSGSRASPGIGPEKRKLQDAATRAWNLHTGLYYKAGGRPWRMTREDDAIRTCYLGIGFFATPDREEVETSVAQVFDERGAGLVVKGGTAYVEKEDRTPHLARDDAYAVVGRALGAFKQEHYHLPARLVVHKTSYFTEAEMEGAEAAAADAGINFVDLFSVRKSTTRLMRGGAYPPLRGTWVELEEDRYLLYTRGSVTFFETYPGMYVPRPLEVQIERSDTAPEKLLAEVLALTKMNWNNTQFDNGLPITTAAARRVGDVMKYALGDEAAMPAQYGFYM